MNNLIHLMNFIDFFQIVIFSTLFSREKFLYVLRTKQYKW